MRRYLLALAFILFLPHSAFAACASPAGIDGQTMYDSTAHLLKFCNDTAWISVGSGGATTLAGLSDVNTAGVTAGKVLTYNGTTSKWQAATGGGIVQTKSSSTTSTASSSSNTFVSTGLSVTITPTSATNKVLVRATTTIQTSGVTCYRQAEIDLRRGTSTSLGLQHFLIYENTGNNNQNSSFTIEFLDSPATTAAVTYNLYFRRDWSGSTCAIAATAQADGTLGTITAEEVKM